MRVYLVRHGIAEMRSIAFGPDEDRALTAGGSAMIRRVAAGLARAGHVPDLILSSPFLRARQTAETLGEQFGAGIPLGTLKNLVPGGDAEALYRIIVRHSRNTRRLMLVGHQPSLGETAGRLLFGSREHGFDLREGDVCVLDTVDYQGQIRARLFALLPPEIWSPRNAGT